MTRQRSHREWFQNDPRYAGVPREIRAAGSTGVTLVEIDQPGGFFERGAAPEYSLNLFMDVDCRAWGNLGGKRINADLRSGWLHMSPSDVDLQYENDGPMRSHIILIPTALVRRVCEECAVDSAAVTFERLIQPTRADALITALVGQLWLEAESRDPTGAMFTDTAVRLLVTSLLRSGGEVAPRTTRGGLAGWQVKRACDAIDAMMDGELGLDELAAIVGLSPTHFSRAFKQSVGMSPFNWLRNRRIERAKEMLVDPGLPLADVALSLGFSAQPEFTTAFKRATGVTPGAWRRERLF